MHPVVTDGQPFRSLRLVLAVAAVIAGALLVLLAVAVGHCSAFGGRCPAEPVPLWEDDVFGTSFAGGLVAVAVPVWLARPGWRRMVQAAAVGTPVALLIALVARGVAVG